MLVIFKVNINKSLKVRFFVLGKVSGYSLVCCEFYFGMGGYYIVGGNILLFFLVCRKKE